MLEEGEEIEDPGEDEPSLDDQLAMAKDDLRLGPKNWRFSQFWR